MKVIYIVTSEKLMSNTVRSKHILGSEMKNARHWKFRFNGNPIKYQYQVWCLEISCTTKYCPIFIYFVSIKLEQTPNIMDY